MWVTDAFWEVTLLCYEPINAEAKNFSGAYAWRAISLKWMGAMLDSEVLCHHDAILPLANMAKLFVAPLTPSGFSQGHKVQEDGGVAVTV